jgi:transmembrane sensor
MSEPQPSHTNAQSADAIHARAIEWLLARDEAESWSAEEQAELDAWLNESPAHLLAYWRAKSGWKRTEVLNALRAFRPQGSTAPNERRARWRLPLAAASLAVVAMAGLVAANWETPGYVTYATDIGGHKTLALGDGSQIELNTDTVVRLPRGKGRQVILEKGEAFFQIKHDEANPFVVTTSTGRVVDLGTKFSIRQGSGGVKVVLVEGRARFEGGGAESEHRSVVLDPGDVVLATADSVSLTKKPALELKNDLGWRRGMLIFRHSTLGDAAAEFNRYNKEKIIIGDAAVAQLEIRGTFHTADVALFARMAEKALGLRTSAQGNEITITR